MRNDATAQQRCLRLVALRPLPIKVISKATHRSVSATYGALKRLAAQGYVATKQQWDFNAGRYVDLYFATRHGLDQTKEIA